MSLLNIVNENDNEININCDKPAYIRGIDGREVTVVKVETVSGYNQVVSPENYSFEDALADAADGMIKLQYYGREYQASQFSDTSIVFTNIDESTSTSVIWDKYNNSDSITVRSVGLESVSHRVNAITQDSTNAQYPSAKAVYNLVTTYPGTVGPQGKPGSDGVDGEDGAPGADGKSAYQIAVDNGYTGTEAQFAELLMSAANKLDKPLTPGTEGQVLTADGAGGQAWQTPATGGSEINGLIALYAAGLGTWQFGNGANDYAELCYFDAENAQSVYDNDIIAQFGADFCIGVVPVEDVDVEIITDADYNFEDYNFQKGKFYLFNCKTDSISYLPEEFSTAEELLRKYFGGINV